MLLLLALSLSFACAGTGTTSWTGHSGMRYECMYYVPILMLYARVLMVGYLVLYAKIVMTVMASFAGRTGL